MSRKRRRRGTGSIFRPSGQTGWVASVHTTLGPRRRRATDYADAKKKLAELKREFRDILPREYLPWRRGGEGESRLPIRASIRFAILVRDGHRCVYCGATAGAARLVIDHVVAVANGGTDNPENLVTACEPCNLGKGAL